MHEDIPSAELVQNFRDGSESAAGELFDRYVDRLTRLARMRIAIKLQARIDPEDVVLSAYRSFFVAARRDRFTFAERGDLWRLLARMTLHKLARQAARHTADKRSVDGESKTAATDNLVDRQPTPDEAVAFAEELEAVMQSLEPPARRLLELRLQGYSYREIAREIGVSERSIRRQLMGVRRIIQTRGGLSETDDLRDHDPEDEDAPSVTAVHNTVPRARRAELISDEISHLAAALFARVGELQFSDYRLQQHLGTGASGRVYRSLESATGRTVAVKFLRKELLANVNIVRRFVEEADIVARLEHSAIVAVHGIGRTPIGGFFIVQEWIDGDNLAEATSRQPPDCETAARWIAEAAAGIQHAHEWGIIHCDLKPANLLLGRDGRVRVTDFGLSRRIEAATTGGPSIAGTLGFMAPEQIEPACGSIAPQTDVYGLGAVLYCLLTGRPPVVGERVEDILTRIVAGRAIPPLRSLNAAVADALAMVVERCLHPSPANRFATAAEVAAAIRNK